MVMKGGEVWTKMKLILQQVLVIGSYTLLIVTLEFQTSLGSSEGSDTLGIATFFNATLCPCHGPLYTCPKFFDQSFHQTTNPQF